MPSFRAHTAAVLMLLPALTLSTAPSHQAPRPASRASQASPAWRLAATQHFGQPGNASGYSVILVVGRQVWVFGGTNPGGQSAPVALSRVGQGWRAANLPARLSDFISDANATSATDIWAISSYGRYVLHWNGRHWLVARRWGQQGVLSDVTAISPANAWVFGTSATGNRSIGTWHYDGGRWIAVSGIAREIYRASAVSGRDIWAIAAGPTSDTIVHLAGTRWHRVATGRALAGIRWHDILAESAHDVWLVGNTASLLGSGRLMLAHWNGARWSRFVTSLQAWAGQLASADRDRVVATATSSGLLAVGLIAEISSNGRMTWSSFGSSFGSGVSDAAFDPRAGVLWASGGILTRRGGDAAIWEHNGPAAPRKGDGTGA
jgi:hypothetical protein